MLTTLIVIAFLICISQLLVIFFIVNSIEDRIIGTAFDIEELKQQLEQIQKSDEEAR